uniref:Testis expressed 2 n=2 Tax=Oryzias sinensis TaxID=183150 RepID=A0A8C7XJA9_9TELE
MMSSQGSSGSKGSGQHPDTPPLRHAPGPRLQVQRSRSRDTITIHFSALGKEEEDEEDELYGIEVGPAATASVDDESGGRQGGAAGVDELCVTTGLEAKEEMLFESAKVETSSGAAVLPVSSITSSVQLPDPYLQTLSATTAVIPISTHSHLSSTPPASSSWPTDRPAHPPPTSSSSSSPCRSTALSSSKPFLSLVRSLSNDVESRETPVSTAVPPHTRPRQLMKSFVRSLSTDISKAEHQEGSPHHYPQQIPSHRAPPRNMQLFKQFSQPRLSSTPVIATQAGGDSKTAPSSPIMSPDGRSFFKVQEVEAKIEDTKRRLSEVMSDPLQLFSKIMGDESGVGFTGSAHRAKSLSTSASELSGANAVNGHTDANSNYSIKEEGGEGEEEEKTPTGKGPDSVLFSFPSLSLSPALAQAPSPALCRSPSITMGRCSMSALVARQEDEDFCELYSEDFDVCTDTETPDGDRSVSRQPHTGSTGLCSELDAGEEEGEEEEVDCVTGLIFLTQMIYLYLVLPVPPCVCSVLHGIVAGFVLALLVLWLSSPQPSSSGTRIRRQRMERLNFAQLDISEPEIFKGWMNEIYSYDPEMYHATLTHSVYVRLEGSVLRLSKPNRNISRRATHNEPKPDVTYISQKIFDLTDSKISLMPQSLARKRVWNKKYPICIELAKQDDFMSKAQEERCEAAEDRLAGQGERTDHTDRPEGSASTEEQKRPSSGGGDLTIYLFGRTGREKEEWFRRFLLASRVKLEGRGGGLAGVGKSAFLPAHSCSGSFQAGGGLEADRGSHEELSSLPCGPTGGSKQKMQLDYNVYMAKYVNPQAPPRSPFADDSPGQSPESSPQTTKKLQRSSEETDESELWVNAFLGRIFWDFLRESYWADVVSKKIQMKLSKIRLPYVMNELTLTELDMGFSIPKILRASKPSVDHKGLWFDLEISYRGSFLMTLETKLNLARLGKEGEGLGEHGKEWPRSRTYCLADSDEESSSAGSSDEEDPPEVLSDKSTQPGAEGYVGGHRPSKIMRLVDKIAKSKYFQKATETEFIKKKMEEVSNTPLLLTVEVQECRGTLAVNIPPPPTDRIWYGFRSPPHLELKARPKLGEREVTLGHVTEWIEKKLDQEFQKIFVMPNMDDLWLPIMHSAMDTRSNANLMTVINDAMKDTEPEESDIPDV